MQRNTIVIAEIGINANGSVDLAKQLIDAAVDADCDYVKFQKRTPDICVPEAQKSKLRETPWGKVPYIQYKHKIEFGAEEYKEISKYCEDNEIGWFASVWDIPSTDFMAERTSIGKIPSALITNLELVSRAREVFDTLIISTGMSTQSEIDLAVDVGDPDVIMHSVSSYPSKIEELNLEYVRFLKNKFPDKEIGYSGHEMELETTVAAAAMGAHWVERHITLDRTMWGSDQSSSVEPEDFKRMVKMIRNVDRAKGKYGSRELMGSERAKRESLRK